MVHKYPELRYQRSYGQMLQYPQTNKKMDLKRHCTVFEMHEQDYQLLARTEENNVESSDLHNDWFPTNLTLWSV